MAKHRSTKPKATKRASSPKHSKKARSKSPLFAKNARNGAPTPARGKQFLSDKVGYFTESVIREMTRQAMLYGAVNLAQGFPDFSAPAEIKQAAQQAVAADVNQYAITWGERRI